MFSSGSWATLNYLKLLPTPKTFNDSSFTPNTSNNEVFSKQNHLPYKLKSKNNNNTELRISETMNEPKNKLNSLPKMNTSESRANSIFDFDVQYVPVKVTRIGVIRLNIYNFIFTI